MSSKQALIPIMNGQYERIAAIESEWGIRFKEGDMRPRIEHFHDAVRALTSGEVDPYGRNSRLSVEYLAYDLSQLRQIQGNPVGRIHYGAQGAPSAALSVAGQTARPPSPDAATRRELAQLYKDYTVLFAALFAEIADMNFQARADEVDRAVEDIALIEQITQQLANGTITVQQATAMLEQVQQDSLRQRAQAAVAGGMRHAEQERMSAQLQAFEGQLEAEKKRADQAHTSYLTGQLAVYEEGRDTVKRLAAQGMNLAGKFVEAAMSQASGKGRGV